MNSINTEPRDDMTQMRRKHLNDQLVELDERRKPLSKRLYVLTRRKDIPPLAEQVKNLQGKIDQLLPQLESARRTILELESQLTVARSARNEKSQFVEERDHMEDQLQVDLINFRDQHITLLKGLKEVPPSVIRSLPDDPQKFFKNLEKGQSRMFRRIGAFPEFPPEIQELEKRILETRKNLKRKSKVPDSPQVTALEKLLQRELERRTLIQQTLEALRTDIADPQKRLLAYQEELGHLQAELAAIATTRDQITSVIDTRKSSKPLKSPTPSTPIETSVVEVDEPALKAPESLVNAEVLKGLRIAYIAGGSEQINHRNMDKFREYGIEATPFHPGRIDSVQPDSYDIVLIHLAATGHNEYYAMKEKAPENGVSIPTTRSTSGLIPFLLEVIAKDRRFQHLLKKEQE